MKKNEILENEGWKYISSLSLTQRHSAIFGNSQEQIEAAYNVKIEKRLFTELSEIPEDCVTLSVQDNFRDMCFIAVLVPTN